MCRVTPVSVGVGVGQGLHQLPAAEVGDPGVAELAGPYEVVEGGEHLLDRGSGVEGVQVEEVDVVRAEAAQGPVDGGDQPGARGARVGRSVARREPGLGGDDHLVAPAPDRGAEYLLRRAAGVDVGGVEHGHPGLQADVHQPAGLRGVRGAPGAEQLSPAAERAGAEAQLRDHEPGRAQSPEFHDGLPFVFVFVGPSPRRAAPVRVAQRTAIPNGTSIPLRCCETNRREQLMEPEYRYGV